jgi:archaemetzincin
MTHCLDRREWLVAASALAASFAAPLEVGAAPGHEPSTLPTVFIQPLGKGPNQTDIGFVAQSLSAFYRLRVQLLEPTPLPRGAFYPARGRYRAERLLDFLEPRLPKDGHRIVGLTEVDISTTKAPHEDWGILGLATLDGRAAVLSSFRCRRKAQSRQHARIRFGKVAVHEIGHTLGLSHCPSRGCLMEDGGGSVLTSDREYDLCARCRGHLTVSGYALSAPTEIPWPRPRTT